MSGDCLSADLEGWLSILKDPHNLDSSHETPNTSGDPTRLTSIMATQMCVRDAWIRRADLERLEDPKEHSTELWLSLSIRRGHRHDSKLLDSLARYYQNLVGATLAGSQNFWQPQRNLGIA
jgi:hypothetical protein